MSFLDQLAKNLNTQTEFFTQLSNISKDARVNSTSKAKLETQSKSSKDNKSNQNDFETKKKTSFETKSKADFEVKNDKEDFSVKEKDGFYNTAKEVFKEYKVKVDKERDEPDLKEELETADQALDLIFGLVDPQVQAQIDLQANAPKPDLTAALEALEVKAEAQEPDPELLDFFLDRIDLKVNAEIETLTKEIIDLDLNTEAGIAEILEISNNIESLQNVEKAIEGIKIDLTEVIQKEAASISNIEKEIKPEVEILLETKIDTKLAEIKTLELEAVKEVKLEIKPEALKAKPEAQLNLAEISLEEPEADSIKKVLDEVKANLKQEKAVKDTNLKKPETNTNNFNVKVLQEPEPKVQANKTLDYTKAQVEVIESTNTKSSSDSKQDSDLSNDNFETLFPREIKVSNIKVKTLSKPVAIKQLPEVISKEAQSVKSGAKQEVKMILDPQNLGKMQLSIAREDNQIHISMVVRTDEAQTKLEQKIHDIKAVLKDKGFEANIEVTKSDTSNSNLSQGNQGNTSQGNEAKEEQKEKYLNQVPEWISKDVEKLDFTEVLNRAL